jgi:hypothetical protein
MSDPVLLERAAACYLEAGHHVAAFLCYREAGAHLRAAEVALVLGHHAAAAEYAKAGMPVLAAWLLAADDPASARAMITGTDLLSRLVLARCEPGLPLDALAAEVCDGLAAAAARTAGKDREAVPGMAEEWMITLAEQAHRADLAALVFAAAVRGRRIGAAVRWRAWAQRILHTDLVIPDPS